MTRYIVRSGLFLILAGCAAQGSETPSAPVDSLVADTVPSLPVATTPPPRTPVTALSQERIRAYVLLNPCYLPLLQDSQAWQPGTRNGFTYDELFNQRLGRAHPFGNRYLVGDFSSLDHQGNSRGLKEVHPELEQVPTLRRVPPDLLARIAALDVDHAPTDSLYADIRSLVPDSAAQLINFIEKVWKYRSRPIERQYSFAGGRVYAAGQTLCACEAYPDTLLLVARFASSSKRLDGHSEYLPIGKRRRYYAGRYIINSKHWERERRYEEQDKLHDQTMGGGHRHVAFYRGESEMPNFLNMAPAPEFPSATMDNGIHECALSQLARGMLGTPNSIGCIRLSDFGSKYMRWFTTQYCNFFVSYEDDRYLKREAMKQQEMLPFTDQQQGDRFRQWIWSHNPKAARRHSIDVTGNYLSGNLVDAYYEYQEAYYAFVGGLAADSAATSP